MPLLELILAGQALESESGQTVAMLLLHEVHTVVGPKEDEFEAAFRDGWMPALAETDDARLCWFLFLAHGTGRAYQVTTITALRDGAAYERLATRIGRAV
jgi:hypothetical protein